MDDNFSKANTKCFAMKPKTKLTFKNITKPKNMWLKIVISSWPKKELTTTYSMILCGDVRKIWHIKTTRNTGTYKTHSDRHGIF